MTLKKILAVGVVAYSLIITGCGGGSSPSAPDALVFNEQNAGEIAFIASLFAQTSPNIVTAVDSNLPSSKAAIDIITELAFDRSRHDSNVVIGVVPGATCSGGGSTTFEGLDSANSRTGTVSFNSCIEDGLVIDGSFTIESTWNDTTGDYLNTGSGSITMSAEGQSFTLVLDFSSDGNIQTGDFSNDVYFSMSFPGYGSFSVDTTSPIVGNYYSGITSGVIVVSGGQNTRIRITFNNGVTTVDLDNGNGSFVYHNSY